MIKKIFKYVVLLLLTSVLLFSIYSFINYRISVNRYEADMETTIKLEPQNLETILSENEQVFVYLGRPTCPYCRVFSPELASAITETDTDVYYIQTTTNDKDETLNKIRDEYDVEFVPTLLKITTNETITYDFEEDLEMFLKQ